MSARDVISRLDLFPDSEAVRSLKKESSEIASLLKKELKKKKVSAEVFLGGSFVKGTLIKSPEGHDIDIFVRFNPKYDNIAEILEPIAGETAKRGGYRKEKVHGSRDYFRLYKNKKAIFEIVPVLKIKKPQEAKNVTDLSYFHVEYVKKKLKDKKIANEVAAAKQFCKAQGIYGAESYINGFSGYGLECLVIYYKSLERMLKALAKVKERIVIDPEKKFKNKEEALVEINEGKLNSPIVLIDPTWKERNALAALSWETFLKFQNIARDFLKKPDASFFERREINGEEIKKEAAAKKMEFVIIKTRTDRQEGDIAGTKLKKFFNFIVKEISTYFEVVRSEFAYDEKHGAESYFALKSKGAVEKKGPPVALKEAAEMFRKNNKCVYEKNEFLYAKTKINFSASDFLKDFFKKYKKKIGEMGITAIEVGN